MASLKVLLTGPTGYVGGWLIPTLLELPATVQGVVRDASKGQALVEKYGPSFTYATLDLNVGNIEDFKALLRQSDVAIHTAAVFSPDGIAFEHALAAAVIEVGQEAALAHRKFHFILTSGSLNYGESDDIITESSSTELPDSLIAWKTPLENSLLNAISGSFLVSIVRSTFIYPGTHLTTYANASAREGKLRVGPNPRNYVSFIHIEDLVELYRLIITKEATGVFNGVDQTPLRHEQVIQRIQEITQVGETEAFTNPFELLHSHGFFIYGLTKSQRVATERAAEIGWVLKYPSWLEAPKQI